MVGRRLVVVLAGASMVLASFGVASAHDSVADSNVTIKESKKGVKGKVTSTEVFCSVAREVTVYKVKKSDDKKIDSALSDLNGKWSLKIKDAKGKYYAVVDRTVDEVEYVHLHECKASESDKVKIGGHRVGPRGGLMRDLVTFMLGA